MKTVSTYLDKNNQRCSKESAWTIMTQVYNDAGNLQRTGYSKGPAQLAAENKNSTGKLQLTLLSTGEVRCFEKNLVKLGRDERCDMVISIGEKKKIDKVHAAFELKMGKWNVIDQSKAGVWVNDVKLAPNSPKTLEEGDVIDLGQRFKLRFM